MLNWDWNNLLCGQEVFKHYHAIKIFDAEEYTFKAHDFDIIDVEHKERLLRQSNQALLCWSDSHDRAHWAAVEFQLFLGDVNFDWSFIGCWRLFNQFGKGQESIIKSLTDLTLSFLLF